MAQRRRLSSQSYNIDWNLTRNENGSVNVDVLQCVLLQEVRDELKRLNTLLHCSNFVGIPSTLRSIRRAMPVRKPRPPKERTR